jgi:hypothetical protein
VARARLATARRCYDGGAGGGDEGRLGDGADLRIYRSVPARWGFEVANAALNVFNPLSTGVDVCVLSNGVLLERQ